ncbi:MAG: hypothetical protein ACTSVV_11750 [Promethearchaeota archaeon]
MAIFEVGINIGNRNLLDIQYYSASNNQGLDSNLRAGFLSALESFTTEVFGDNLNVVSLASFKLVCHSQTISFGDEPDKKDLLLCYAIIEKDTDVDIVNEHLKIITEHFLNRFSSYDILTKKKKYFRKFEERVNDILGDLRLKIQDRFRAIF